MASLLPLAILFSMGLTGSVLAIVKGERTKDTVTSSLAAALVGVQIALIATVGFIWWWTGTASVDAPMLVAAAAMAAVSIVLLRPWRSQSEAGPYSGPLAAASQQR